MLKYKFPHPWTIMGVQSNWCVFLTCWSLLLVLGEPSLKGLKTKSVSRRKNVFNKLWSCYSLFVPHFFLHFIKACYICIIIIMLYAVCEIKPQFPKPPSCHWLFFFHGYHLWPCWNASRGHQWSCYYTRQIKITYLWPFIARHPDVRRSISRK